MKYLKRINESYESYFDIETTIIREIKFQIGEFITDNQPLNERQFKRQLDLIFNRYLNDYSLKDFDEILNQIESAETELVRNHFQNWIS